MHYRQAVRKVCSGVVKMALLGSECDPAPLHHFFFKRTNVQNSEVSAGGVADTAAKSAHVDGGMWAMKQGPHIHRSLTYSVYMNSADLQM